MGRCCYVVVMLLRKKEDGLECKYPSNGMAPIPLEIEITVSNPVMHHA